MSFRKFGFLFVVLLIVVACSTDKNTFINRLYHGTTAKYNGLYNANVLLNTALQTFNENKHEDFGQILPVINVPNKDEVTALYPAIDTAIKKCTHVITLHAMPTIDKPSKKHEEFNNWIDENFITIGKAQFFRRDFDGSIKNFEFVRKFFRNDKSNYIATMWIARNQIQLGEYGPAKLNLDKLDLAAQKTADQAKEKKSGGNSSDADKKKYSGKFGRLKKKKDKIADERAEKNGLVFVPFPKKLNYDLNLTKGQYYIAKKNYEEAIKSLEAAVKLAKKNDRGRIYFIIGQLYDKINNPQEAAKNYSLVLKTNTKFEINFAARLNRAIDGGGDKMRKALIKMTKDAKNFEYRDQIYYAMGEMEMRAGNRPQAMIDYNKSIFYSINNNLQKAHTYQRLADINYADKNYVKAQRYYDSCSRLVKDDYPDYAIIVNKAQKLQKLVNAIDVATYEDSVQRIAKMDSADRYKFAENLIKKMEAEKERQKQLALERQKELSNVGAITSSTTGSTNYFTNPKLKQKGFEDFRKQWGYRDNEDNWNRSNKIQAADFSSSDSTATDSTNSQATASSGPTPESLLANIPLSDSALDSSNARYVEARYDAGIIYKEQLGENSQAANQFQLILDKQYESKFNPMAAFQLYKIYETSDPSKASDEKNYILTNYPKTDYAEFLKDPDYFIKQKKIEEIYENEYLRYLDRYNRGLYYVVMGKADDVIKNEPKNKYRAKFMLLKAMCLGQMNDDKSLLAPVLQQVITEYPKTDEATKAQEMLNIIKNGVSVNKPVDFNKNKLYEASAADKDFWMVIVLPKELEKDIMNIKNKVSDFNRRFFSKDKLSTETQLIGNVNVITAKAVPSLEEAKMYVQKFGDSKDLLDKAAKSDVFFITKDNLVKLFKDKDISKYQDFFFEKY